MTKEELLKPRIKVTSDFWDNPFKVGDIIEFEYCREYHGLDGDVLGEDWYTDFLPKDNKHVGRTQYALRGFTPYPHLFRKLEWWEERNVKDMPEYVKSTRHGVEFYRWKWHTFRDSFLIYNGVIPATREEYETKHPA